ncbi:MAG: hypothetical protein JO317_00905 [Verrucomicrobiae bacterium]|nr:hypothetical protein [Verrucomicrobiae bacterium]
MHPLLAHGGEMMSFREWLFTTGSVVLGTAVVVLLAAAVFYRPIRRVMRHYREGRASLAKPTILIGAVVIGVLIFAFQMWNYAWGVYFDQKFDEYEKALKASGKHPEGGEEYKWERWHLYAKYIPPHLQVEAVDVTGTFQPKDRLSLLCRRVDPSPTAWQPMAWDGVKNAFVGKIEPQGFNKMKLEYEIRSGWRHDNAEVVVYVPRELVPEGMRKNLSVPPGDED